MDTNRAALPLRPRFVVSGVVGIILAACGGGSGGGNPPSTPSPPGPTSETTALVEQVRWEPSFWDANSTMTASATVDGQSVSIDHVRAGDVVILAGARTTMTDAIGRTTHSDTLRSIVSASVVSGPVDSLDLAHRRIVVMGQPVQFFAVNTTDCQNCDADSGLPQVQIGDFVRVSGYSSASGQIFAQRVDEESGTNQVRVVGVPRAVDASNERFQINDLVIDYGNTTPGISGTALDQGSRVEVVGTLQGTPRVLFATRVVAHDPISLVDYGAGDVVALEGLIDSVSAANEFTVDGYKVIASDCMPRINLPVAVSGTLNDAGSVMADLCSEFASGGEVIDGPVDSVDSNTGSLIVLDVPVQTSFATGFADQQSNPASEMKLTDLKVGDFVQVSGDSTARSPTNGVIGGEVDRTDIGPMKFRARPSSMTKPNVVMFGHTIETNDATTFTLLNCDQVPPAITQDDYFQRGVTFQQIVIDRADDNTLTATHVDVYTPAYIFGCFDY